MAHFFITLMIISSILFMTSHALVQDFCVADYTLPTSPSGYSCKNPGHVTARDFVYSGLARPGTTATLFKGSLTPASYNEFPALNGLRLSMARIDLAPRGVIPLHTHPGQNEIYHLITGKVIAFFVSSDMNRVYETVIESGDLFVIPTSLMHGFVNIGEGPVLAYASYSSESLHIQTVDNVLFNTTLSADVINATTFINPREIERLKDLFGATRN